MKKTVIRFLASCLLLALFGRLPAVSAVEAAEHLQSDSADTLNLSVTSGSHSPDAAVPLLGTERLVDNVSAAAVYEWESETLLYAWNPDEKLDPASFVKIMTALIAVEQGNLDAAVTVTEDVLSSVPFDAVSAELKAGEVLTLRDLLHCMLVASANDAAAVIADYVLGSQEAFVREMNRYAQELGCQTANFVNVHGLYHEQQYMTVRDGARILARAMENEQFREIFGALEYTVPATNQSEERVLETGNFLLSTNEVEIYYDSRAIGGRTGIAHDNTRCLATAAEANGLKLICLTFGSKSVYTDSGAERIYGGYKETSALLDAVSTGYQRVQVLFENQALRQCSVDGGASAVVLAPKTNVSTVLPDSVKTSDLSYRYVDNAGDFTAPIEKGSLQSRLQIWYGGICVAQTELFAMNRVAVKTAPQPPESRKDTISTWEIVLIALVILLFLGAVLVVGTRLAGKVRMATARRHSRRYRESRRRSR